MNDRHQMNDRPDPHIDPAIADALRSIDIESLRRRQIAKWQNSGAPFNAWIADMDFPVAQPIARRLAGVVENDELGYPTWLGQPSPAIAAFAGRMADRYGWQPHPDDLFDMADVLQGVQVSIAALSQPGDGIIVHLPAYYPFLLTAELMERPLIPVLPTADRSSGMTSGDRGAPMFDYDDLERRLEVTPARLWILCHPHNPLGHVFETDELERIAAIAERFDLIVISDEIHADLRFGGAGHVPFARVANPERVVTVSSASKAFNLAGLRWAVLHSGPDRLTEWVRSQPPHLLGAPNRMAVDATVAAWAECEDWLAAVLDVIDENRRTLTDLLNLFLPGARYRPPDATYLAWVDVSGCDLGGEPAEVFRRRGVEVSDGPVFGAPGAGHVRINLATSPTILAATIAAMGQGTHDLTPSG